MATTDELVPTTRVFDSSWSRYHRVSILRDGTNHFFATQGRREYPYSPEDRYHEVSAGEVSRLDLIAYEHYATPLLWWVIAEANDIFHPLKEVVAGKVLRIPAPIYVFSSIVR